ncbi:hypothetical protein RRG08_013303 [Elysia crispata]|uniref:Uncharacterized protein n=1 Tax=Elysia crispata TaxID=231223 RepID=A0AAE1AWZ9_9GAST|nr:hypothetical protein RRG08_013303 [Elysia crispata]
MGSKVTLDSGWGGGMNGSERHGVEGYPRLRSRVWLGDLTSGRLDILNVNHPGKLNIAFMFPIMTGKECARSTRCPGKLIELEIPEGHDLGYPNRTQTLRQQKIVNLWITTYALARSQDFDLFESQLLTCHCNRKCERLLRHLSSLTFSVQIVEICVDFAVASFPEDPLVHKEYQSNSLCKASLCFDIDSKIIRYTEGRVVMILPGFHHFKSSRTVKETLERNIQTPGWFKICHYAGVKGGQKESRLRSNIQELTLSAKSNPSFHERNSRNLMRLRGAPSKHTERERVKEGKYK